MGNGNQLKQIVAGQPLPAVGDSSLPRAEDPARLTQPPMSGDGAATPESPFKVKSLMSQAGDVATVLQEMEKVIVSIETRISGFQAEREDHAPAEGASLSKQLRCAAEHAADLTGRLDAVLRAL